MKKKRIFKLKLKHKNKKTVRIKNDNKRPIYVKWKNYKKIKIYNEILAKTLRKQQPTKFITKLWKKKFFLKNVIHNVCKNS